MPLVNFRPLAGNLGCQLYRTGTLARINRSDIDYLKSISLKMFIDLRSRDEIAHEPVPDLTLVENLRIIQQPIEQPGDLFFQIKNPQEEDYKGSYLRMIETNQQSIAQTIRIISETQNQTIAFGCTAGKDRTGVVASLILAAVAMDEMDISMDFENSGKFLVPHTPYFLKTHNRHCLGEAEYKQRLTLSRRLMLEFLADLKKRHGSVLRLLASWGITQPEVSRLAQRFTIKTTS